MFDGCGSLTVLDVSGFDTAHVTNMSLMFYNCNQFQLLLFQIAFYKYHLHYNVAYGFYLGDGYSSYSQFVANSFSAPEGATNVEWSVNTSGDSPLVQLTFDLDDLSFTAREQVTGDVNLDISGMYDEWDAEDDD